VGWLPRMWAHLHRMWARNHGYLQGMWARFCPVCGPNALLLWSATPTVDWFSLAPESDAAVDAESSSPEEKLLCAIVLRALQDAHGRPSVRQREARQWLASAACAELCACVGLPHTRIMALVAQLRRAG
jgi:hypothetical protein